MPDGLPPLTITLTDEQIEAWEARNAAARSLLARVVAVLREAGDAPLAHEVDAFFCVNPPTDPVL